MQSKMFPHMNNLDLSNYYRLAERKNVSAQRKCVKSNSPGEFDIRT